MLSPLQKKRLEYKPPVPEKLKNLQNVSFKEVPSSRKPEEDVQKLFPRTKDLPFYELISGGGTKRKVKVGVVFSGGPAPGGHNVIAGLFDSGAEVLGFLSGPSGIVENKFKEIKDISNYRNQGGFDLIGTGRTKIETDEQLSKALKTVNDHDLDGLLVIGGDDSNTNAAVLAEYFLKAGSKTCVIGVPKTIDADLRSADIEMSFGFDSACKTYAEMVGNIQNDALSSLKYYHFIRLMGRTASHITLECALKTQPNLAIISEERASFETIINRLVNLIIKRFEANKQYGVILIPEGLIESVPEFDQLIQNLPVEKDPHGNVELSKIESEKIIIEKIKEKLEVVGFKGKFNALSHSFGYEGRSCLPSNFDATYCYSLGLLASVAIREKVTGAICSIQKIKGAPKDWDMKMVPIVQLMHIEKRLGKEKPVIKKTLVDIKGKPFVKFTRLRTSWELDDDYRGAGPMQFFGDAELTDSVPYSLQ